MFEEGGFIFSQSAAFSCTSFATVVLPTCHMPLHKEHTCALLQSLSAHKQSSNPDCPSLTEDDFISTRELEFFNLWEKITLHIIQDSLQIEEGNAYDKLNTNPSM